MERNRKPDLLFLCILSAGLLIRIYLSWRPFIYIDNLFIPDDAYISLKIAKNIASGLGITFDGIHPTNGFHCLYVFLMTPLYILWNHDLITPVHLALTFSSLCDTLTILLIYKIVLRLSDRSSALFSAFVWSFSPPVISNTLNGLETSLFVFLIALSGYYYIAKVREEGRFRQYAVLGLLLGLLFLTRTDAIFFALAILADLAWINRSRTGAVQGASFANHVAALAIGSLVVLCPWWFIQIYNQQSIIPESLDSLKFQVGAHNASPGWNISAAFFHVANSISPAFFRFKFILFTLLTAATLAIQLAAFAFLFVITGFILYGLQRFLKKTTSDSILFLLLYSLLLFLFYSLYLPAFWFMKRYYHPIALIMTMYCGLLLFLISKKWLGTGAPLMKAAVIAMVYVLTAYSFAPSLWLFVRSTPGHCVPLTISDAKGYYSTAQAAGGIIPPGAKVGAFQAGAFGYVLENNPVLNLDGKVNRDAMNALQQHRIFDYMLSQNIAYLICWDWNFESLLLKYSGQPQQHITERLVHIADLPPQETDIFRIYKIAK